MLTTGPFADLVPKEVAENWLKYFRQELPTIAFKASTKKGGGTIAHKATSKRLKGKAVQGALGRKRPQENCGAEDMLGSSECLGADTLIQLLKNYTRNIGIKTAITVGVVGMPNVGKSSLINSLKRSRVAQVCDILYTLACYVQPIHLFDHPEVNLFPFHIKMFTPKFVGSLDQGIPSFLCSVANDKSPCAVGMAANNISGTVLSK